MTKKESHKKFERKWKEDIKQKKLPLLMWDVKDSEWFRWWINNSPRSVVLEIYEHLINDYLKSFLDEVEKGTIIIYEDDGSVRPKEETINQFSFFIENYDTIINKGVKSNSEGKVVNDTLSDKL